MVIGGAFRCVSVCVSVCVFHVCNEKLERTNPIYMKKRTHPIRVFFSHIHIVLVAYTLYIVLISFVPNWEPPPAMKVLKFEVTKSNSKEGMSNVETIFLSCEIHRPLCFLDRYIIGCFVRPSKQLDSVLVIIQTKSDWYRMCL